LQTELDGLNGGAGSITTQIENALAALDLPNTYEAKGAAADALADAKSYVDGKVDGKFDAAGTAAGLNTAMDARVVKLEAIDHNKIAADAAAAAVAGVIDDAPESFDTLKEVAAWIANNDHASDVATLMTDVANLKNIDHDAYVAADATTLTAAKNYVDGKVDGKFDAVGAAATAKAEAIADAEGKYQVKGSYEVEGAAAQALVDAKAYVDGKVDGKFDAAGAAADAQAAAIAQAKADATEALKAYYTKTEVDNLLSTNSNGDRAYAKQYTDELFGSFKFAQNSEIDALFA
jgi:Flp pilus assembly pilin Flp